MQSPEGLEDSPFKKLFFVTKIVLTYCEKKIVLLIEKNFWNSRSKAENLQKILDH
jgi:hypothetical protein